MSKLARISAPRPSLPSSPPNASIIRICRDAEQDRGRPQITESDLQKLIDARRLRVKFFDQSLFADPAWDILLDLYRAHLAQQRICVTSVCFGAGVPVSTALRWLNALEERGLARRSHDPLDGRRYFVSLTEAGVSSMDGYFAAAVQSFPQIA